MKKILVLALGIFVGLGLSSCDPQNKTIRKVNNNFLDKHEGDVKKLRKNHNKAKKASKKYRIKALEEELKKYEEDEYSINYIPEEQGGSEYIDEGYEDYDYYNSSSYYPNKNYGTYRQPRTSFENIDTPETSSYPNPSKKFVKPNNRHTQQSFDHLSADKNQRAEDRKDVINMAKAQKEAKAIKAQESKEKSSIGEKIKGIFGR